MCTEKTGGLRWPWKTHQIWAARRPKNTSAGEERSWDGFPAEQVDLVRVWLLSEHVCFKWAVHTRGNANAHTHTHTQCPRNEQVWPAPPQFPLLVLLYGQLLLSVLSIPAHFCTFLCTFRSTFLSLPLLQSFMFVISGLKKGPQNADYHCVADEPATESARLYIILNSIWSILEPSLKQPLQISSLYLFLQGRKTSLIKNL